MKKQITATKIATRETLDKIRTSRKGLSFGVASGVITTLGLIIGLAFSTGNRIAIIGGIVVIAVADALSDAFGIHISEESVGGSSKFQVWITTLATAFYKFIFAISFLVPVILLNLGLALIVSVVWGLFLISFISFRIAKKQRVPAWKPILEHIVIATIVVIVSYLLGNWIGNVFI